MHSLSNLDEASNVATGNKTGELALLGLDVLLGSVETALKGVLHDLLEAVVDLLAGPGDALAVLSHLETRDGDTTSVGSLSGGVPDGRLALGGALSLEDVNGLLGAAHVGALGDGDDASLDEVLGLVLADLVLRSTRQSDVDLADVDPGAGALDVLELAVAKGRQSLALDLELGNGVDVLGREGGALLGDEAALGVGERDDGGAELEALEGGVLGDVSGAGDGDALAGKGAVARVLEHVLDVVDETVAGGLGSDQAAAPGEALSGQDALPLVADLAVGAKHPADLAAGHTNVAGGHVGLGANVLAQLAHEGVAEAANLAVALALGVKVGATLAAAHAQAGQGVLEDLLKAEELEDGQVDRGVEAQAALVGAQGRVELHAVSAVDAQVARIVLPGDAELNHPLGDGGDGERGAVLGVLGEELAVLERRGQLRVGLLELGLRGEVRHVVNLHLENMWCFVYVGCRVGFIYRQDFPETETQINFSTKPKQQSFSFL